MFARMFTKRHLGLPFLMDVKVYFGICLLRISRIPKDCGDIKSQYFSRLDSALLIWNRENSNEVFIRYLSLWY